MSLLLTQLYVVNLSMVFREEYGNFQEPPDCLEFILQWFQVWNLWLEAFCDSAARRPIKPIELRHKYTKAFYIKKCLKLSFIQNYRYRGLLQSFVDSNLYSPSGENPNNNKTN